MTLLEELPQSGDAEAGVEQSEVSLSRDFPSTKDAFKEAKRFFVRQLVSYYRKNNKAKASGRRSVSRPELDGLAGGFMEVFSNALVHGNLGLDDKASDVAVKPADDAIWKPGMNVRVVLTLRPNGFEVTVTDEGKGKFELEKIIERIRKIKEGDLDAVLDFHRRAYLFIRHDQYGSPALVHIHRDAQGQKTGTSVTLKRDFDVPLSSATDVSLDDYVIEV